MKIAIIGTGYVGLVSGVCFASKGHSVTCFDSRLEPISLLKDGKIPIYENGLNELLINSKKNISFEVLNLSKEYVLLNFDVILVAVGTPSENGKADLSQIESVAIMLARLIKQTNKFISIILRSTVPPGTTDTFFKNIIEKNSNKSLGNFGLGMNPEFLREGNAVDDFLKADRIVMGHEDPDTLNILKEMYASWNCEKIELNSRSAEMMKYVNNTILATLISSVNEHANIAREIGDIDFKKVMKGVYFDNRWSPLMNNQKKLFPEILDYLKPGPGYGGSCFPKDVMALSSLSKELSIPSKIIDAVIAVNEEQPKQLLKILKNKIKNLSDKSVLILGLSFKPDTDDIRESISLKFINLLYDEVSSLAAHDPIAIENTKKSINSTIEVSYVSDWESAVLKADIIIIATNWSIYKSIDKLGISLSNKIIFDTRSLLNSCNTLNENYLTFN